MTRRILFRTVWLLVILGIGVTRAHAELPAVVEVAVPGGGKIRVALPPHICAYPKEVRDRLAQFLLGSEDGLHLLGAGGACADIDHLIREGTAVVSPSMQLAMQKNQIDPITRSTPASYRRLCFEQFPSKGEHGVADPLRRSLTEADQKLTLGETASLGLLAAETLEVDWLLIGLCWHCILHS